MINLDIVNISEEEATACKELIEKMREEKRKKEAYEQNRTYLRSIVSLTIDSIGLEETKQIIREINKDLRSTH